MKKSPWDSSTEAAVNNTSLLFLIHSILILHRCSQQQHPRVRLESPKGEEEGFTFVAVAAALF
jgi:hypothetical protein